MAGEYFMVQEIADMTRSAKNVISELEGLTQLPPKEAAKKLDELAAKGKVLSSGINKMAMKLSNESQKYIKRNEGDMHASAMSSRIVPQAYVVSDQIMEEIEKAKRAIKEAKKHKNKKEESKTDLNELKENETEEQGPSQE